MRLRTEHGKILGWYCSVHNLFNDILTTNCKYCNEIRPKNLQPLSYSTAAKRMGLVTMEKELYEKFYAGLIVEGERAIVNINDDDALTEHIRQLEEICFKAKVLLIPALEKKRKLKADKNHNWLLPSNDVDVEESIKGVETRQKRLSKMDKVAALLGSIMGVEDAASIVRTTNSKATDKNVSNAKLVDKIVESRDTVIANDELIDLTKFK